MSSAAAPAAVPATPAGRLVIRDAVVGDAPRILDLIRELAAFERAPDAVKNTVAQLTEDGWGPEPRFFAFMAEYVDDSNTALQPAVGFALCYYAYSTWQGTCLFLEDIYVQETFRAQGVGMALMTRCIREASQRNCARVQFQALDWNTPALEFYKKVGASETRDWIPIRFEREAIAGFLEKYDKR